MTVRSSVCRRTLVVTVAAAMALAVAPAAPGSADVTSYRYPVRPGTAEWRALKTHQDMVGVTQLPAGLAATMPTDKLVSTVLEYPLLLDALAFNSVQTGFDTVASRFNGLTELLRRPDSGTALLNRYRRLQVRAPVGAHRPGEHALDVWKVETLLAQPQVLGTLSAKQLNTLLRVGRDKYAAKQGQAELYGQAGLEPTAVLLGRALAVTEGWDWTRSPALRDATPWSGTALDEIVPTVERHFAEPHVDHPAGVDLRLMDHGGTVLTPRGTPVPVIVVTSELSPELIAELNAEIEALYPEAVRYSDASRRYNCHSFAWYWPSTSNSVWMNTPGDDTYWEDGSYTAYDYSGDWPQGMRWSWANGDHSGFEVGAGYIMSKWGMYPVMVHRGDYSPYDSSVINYYFLTP